MTFCSLHVGFRLLNLWGDWFLQAQNRLIFLNLLCECLYLQPPQIYSFSWHFLSWTNQTNKTFWRRYHGVCKYKRKGDDYGAGKERKMSLPSEVWILPFKTCYNQQFLLFYPPNSQSLPQNAQSTLLLPEKHFSSEKYQNDLIAVLFLMHHSTRWYGLLII